MWKRKECRGSCGASLIRLKLNATSADVNAVVTVFILSTDHPEHHTMAEHPSFTLAGLRKHLPCCLDKKKADKVVVAVGGTAGYIRTRSTPSLVAGLVLGASYGYAGEELSWHVPR